MLPLFESILPCPPARAEKKVNRKNKWTKVVIIMDKHSYCYAQINNDTHHFKNMSKNWSSPYTQRGISVQSTCIWAVHQTDLMHV